MSAPSTAPEQPHFTAQTHFEAKFHELSPRLGQLCIHSDSDVRFKGKGVLPIIVNTTKTGFTDLETVPLNTAKECFSHCVRVLRYPRLGATAWECTRTCVVEGLRKLCLSQAHPGAKSAFRSNALPSGAYNLERVFLTWKPCFSPVSVHLYRIQNQMSTRFDALRMKCLR